jgi:hypothetical protein
MARIPRRPRGYFISGDADWEERAKIISLRARGLTFTEIGRQLA